MKIYACAISILMGLSGAASTASAAETVKSETQDSGSVQVVIGTPFELVSSGYEGKLSKYGVPGFASFCQGVGWGQIKSTDIFNASVSAGIASEGQRSDDFLALIAAQAYGYCH